MAELAVCVSNDGKSSIYEIIDAIKEAGFKKVFVQWYDKQWDGPDQQAQVDYCKKLGLEIVFAHLGYQSINDIWLDTEVGSQFVERYKKDLDDVKRNGIPMAMMHACSKFEPPYPNELGLSRFEEVVDYANEIGVEIGFENTKVPGYQKYLLKNLKGKAGICLDFGHAHAHFKDDFDFDFFKNKITSVHLHDNFGVKDDHLLPFDGNLDWQWAMSELKKAGYSGPLTLEIVYHRDYVEKMSVKEFYQEGYARGMKLAEMFDKA